MTHTNQLITIGEATLHFKPVDDQHQLLNADQFHREPGGAPVNAAAAAAQLGTASSYIGKMANDSFAQYIIEKLKKAGVSTENVQQSDQGNTRLQFIDQNETINYQSSPVDRLLRPDDIDGSWFNRGDTLYYSALPLAQTPSRGALEKAIKTAGAKGCTIAFAPQITFEDWPNEKYARETVLYNLPYAHVLMLSEEELRFLAEKDDEYDAIKKLFGGKTELLIITRGRKGITYMTKREKGNIRHPVKEVIDQRGMDDAFMGCLFHQMIADQVTVEKMPQFLSDPFSFESVLDRALLYRSMSARRPGAFSAMPAKNKWESEINITAF